MAGDILQRIVDHKRRQVAEDKRRRPLAELEALCRRQGPARGFFDALCRPGPSGVNIIAEFKRASPSKGDIHADADPPTVARAYAAGGAAAVSVLTDAAYFKGSLDDLGKVRRAVDLPVLRKDFVIDPYQVAEARAAGADAVLLIVRILEAAQLAELLDACRHWGLDALVEVHHLADLQAATEAGARLIGINNRNLATFATDIRVAMELAGALRPDQVAVAASGITVPGDVAATRACGIFNFLVGESLMRAADPAAFLRSLMDAAQNSHE